MITNGSNGTVGLFQACMDGSGLRPTLGTQQRHKGFGPILGD